MRFDREASRYHAGVYKAKRSNLIAQLHSTLSPLFLGQLKNLHKQSVTTFRNAVLDGVKGEGYDFGLVVKAARGQSEGAFTSGASGPYIRHLFLDLTPYTSIPNRGFPRRDRLDL